MIDKLKQIEDKLLLDLLSKPELWNSLLIDYHPPIVERVWTQLGNYRLMLHFIQPCEAKDALFHPHPWPSAIHVLHGAYEMGLGFGPGLVDPAKMGTIFVENGGMYYDLTHIDSWHYVRPIDGPCASIMLIGPKWDREEIKSDEPLKPLSDIKKDIILNWFKDFYRQRIATKKLVTNNKLQRGDWALIDESMLTSSEKKLLQPYFGQMGFIISRDGNKADIRFGANRMTIKISDLTILDPKNKPEAPEVVKPVQELPKVEKDIPDDLDERFI